MIPLWCKDTFEAVALQVWDQPRERCGEALSWLEAHRYIKRNRNRERGRSKNDPLGIPAKLTPRGVEEAKRLGLHITDLIAEVTW